MDTRSLRAALQTMHLVEEIAVALYRGPRRALRKHPELLQAFGGFESGERRHRMLFAELLARHGAHPSWLAPWLARLVGFFTLLLALLFGPSLLLRFEIGIERIAIRHYQAILSKNLPEDLAHTVRQVQEDEHLHLGEMQALLQKL